MKAISQSRHLCFFSAKWREICRFKYCWELKAAPQVTHLKSLGKSLWTIAWLSNASFLLNVLEQISHINGFAFSWTDAICLVKWVFLLKLESHIVQWNGFFPSCTDSMWAFKLPFCLKLDWHVEHSKDFWPSWTVAMCSLSLLGLKQGYYNTGWFNPKMRSRANLLICQQTNSHSS